MGRPEKPLRPGPVHNFARDLRQLRHEAGEPSYREMSRKAGFSASALSAAAAGGDMLPSLDVTLAYVGVCRGDQTLWEQRWHELAEQLADARPEKPVAPTLPAGVADAAAAGPVPQQTQGPEGTVDGSSSSAAGRPRIVTRFGIAPLILVVAIIIAVAILKLGGEPQDEITNTPTTAGSVSAGRASQDPTATVEPQTVALPSAPPIELTSPASGTTAQPGCLTVRFTGQPAAGYTFVVADNGQDDPRIYFEGGLRRDPGGRWSTTIFLGDEGRGMGQLYQVHIVMLDQRWAAYLAGTRPESGATWWSSLGYPPGAVIVATVSVRRDANPHMDC
jgi:hypothetical protein